MNVFWLTFLDRPIGPDAPTPGPPDSASTYAAKMDKGGLGSLYPWIAVTATWGIVVFAALDLLNGLVDEFVGSFYETTLYLSAAAGGAGAYLHGQGK